MTDILDLQDWRATATRQEDGEFVIEAEYSVQPAACLKCGVIGRLYKHGPKPITVRDSPVRGRPVRLVAIAQRYKCRECGGTFIQPLGGIQDEMRMTKRCVEYIQEQCLRDTFVRIAEHVGCDDKTVRNAAKLRQVHARLMQSDERLVYSSPSAELLRDLIFEGYLPTRLVREVAGLHNALKLPRKIPVRLANAIADAHRRLTA